jgi:DNA-binding LacI/PurR family transcriptional regulator
VPYINDNLTIGFLNGIESVLREHRYSLIYSPSECDLNLEKEQIQHLMAEKVCGLILMPVSTSNEAALISRVLSKDIQLVVIDRAIPGWVTNGVFVDNLGGGMLAVNHLLEQGYQRVGCITEATYVSAVADRVRGYELAMRQAGLLPLAAIPLDWQHVHWDLHPPVFTLEQMLAVEQFIQSSQEPTAIFCVNDFIAIGVMKYLLAKGYKIPDDVAIAGFDDIPLAQYLPVPLTTVKQPGLEVGREAANLIISLLNDPQQTQRTIVLPTSLVIRQSTRQDYNSEVSGGN